MLTDDGSRRRTVGGIFFVLVKQHLQIAVIAAAEQECHCHHELYIPAGRQLKQNKRERQIQLLIELHLYQQWAQMSLAYHSIF